MEEETEMNISLMNRVYYAARDGMAITLYALLSDKTPEYSSWLINQVSDFCDVYFFVSLLKQCCLIVR